MAAERQGVQGAVLARRQADRGLIAGELGYVAEAKKLIEAALKILDTTNTSPRDLAKLYTVLGRVLMDFSDDEITEIGGERLSKSEWNARAEAAFAKARSLLVAVGLEGSVEHFEAAGGSAYLRAIDDLDSASVDLAVLLADAEKKFGPSSGTAALLGWWLGDLHYTDEKNDKVMEVLGRALAAAQVAYSPNHPRTASIQLSLAWVNDAYGEASFAWAKSFMLDRLAFRRQVDEPVDVAFALADIAELHVEAGKPGAPAYFEEAATLLESRLDQLAVLLNSAALTLKHSPLDDDVVAADAVTTRLITILEATKAPSDADAKQLAEAVKMLAEIKRERAQRERKAGRTEAARKFKATADQIEARGARFRQGFERLSPAQNLECQAVTLEKNSKLAEALVLRRQAVTLMRKAGKVDAGFLVALRRAAALVLRANVFEVGDTDSGLSLAAEAITVGSALKAGTDAEHIGLMFDHAALLTTSGRDAEADAALLDAAEALEARLEQPGTEPPAGAWDDLSVLKTIGGLSLLHSYWNYKIAHANRAGRLPLAVALADMLENALHAFDPEIADPPKPSHVTAAIRKALVPPRPGESAEAPLARLLLGLVPPAGRDFSDAFYTLHRAAGKVSAERARHLTSAVREAVAAEGSLTDAVRLTLLAAEIEDLVPLAKKGTGRSYSAETVWSRLAEAAIELDARPMLERALEHVKPEDAARIWVEAAARSGDLNDLTAARTAIEAIADGSKRASLLASLTESLMDRDRQAQAAMAALAVDQRWQVAGALAKSGDKKAVDSALAAAEPSDSVRALLWTAEAALDRRFPQLAEQALDAAEDQIRRIPNLDDRVHWLNSFAALELKHGRRDRARKLAAEAAAITRKSGIYPCDPDGDKPCLATALPDAADLLARAGDMPEAQAGLDALPIAERAEAWAEFAAKRAKEGRREEARQAIAQARRLAETMTDALGQDYAYRAIASAQAALGDLDDALATLSLAAEVGDVDATKHESKAIDLQVRFLARAGAPSRAELLAERIAEPWHRAEAYAHIAAAWARAGELARAERAGLVMIEAADAVGRLDLESRSSLLSTLRDILPEAQAEAGDIGALDTLVALEGRVSSVARLARTLAKKDNSARLAERLRATAREAQSDGIRAPSDGAPRC